MRTLSCLLAALAIPAVAAAEPLGDADPVHDFHTVDRFTPETSFGVALAYEVWSDNVFGDAPTIFGLDVGGHYVGEKGYGGYAVVPLSFLSIDTSLTSDSSFVLGNLELGGLYTREVKPGVDVVGRVGVVLPTADDDELGSLQVLASVPRYGDLVQRVPDSTWLRLSGSAMGTRGALFWRGDVGLDVALDEGNQGGEITPVFRLNLAGGIDLGSTDVSLELATNVGDDDSINSDDTNTTLGLGARFDAGAVNPGVALLLPLGFEDQGDLEFAIAASLTWEVPVGGTAAPAAE